MISIGNFRTVIPAQTILLHSGHGRWHERQVKTFSRGRLDILFDVKYPHPFSTLCRDHEIVARIKIDVALKEISLEDKCKLGWAFRQRMLIPTKMSRTDRKKLSLPNEQIEGSTHYYKYSTMLFFPCIADLIKFKLVVDPGSTITFWDGKRLSF